MQSDCVLTSSITKWGFKFLLLFIQMLILPLCFVQLHTHINSLTKQLTLWLVCRGTLSALICRLSVIRLVSPLIPPMLCFLIGDHSSAAFRFLLIISSHIKPWLGIPDSNFPAGLTLFSIDHWAPSLSTIAILWYRPWFWTLHVFLLVVFWRRGGTCSDYVWSRVWLATFNERIHRCKKLHPC